MNNGITIRKIRFFQRQLLVWFKGNRRKFPWRVENLSEYHLIISEILLQRTRAETVSGFYEDFLLTHPNWESVSMTDVEELATALKPLGLHNQRAKRLHELAKHMVKINGKVPAERALLDQIPFMGQYIANAVELLIYQRQKPLLDVNMARVLERYFGPRKLVDIRYDPYLQELALKVVDTPKSKEINWAVLDFASLVCKARKPNCSMCILSASCSYFNNEKTIINVQLSKIFNF